MRERSIPTSLMPTAHGVRRQQQRGISDALLQLAIRHGRRHHVGGGRVAYYLGRRDLPHGLKPALAERAEGLVVVLHGEALVTVYRNPCGFRATRRWKGGAR